MPRFFVVAHALLFFTGKGGVGKTSLSTAAAIALADAGLRVLLVSANAASNFDEMLDMLIRNQAQAVPGVPSAPHLRTAVATRAAGRG